MATKTKTIGTSSRDYSTIQAWEDDLDDGTNAANDATAYASTDDAVGEVYDDASYDESVTINGGSTVGLSTATLTVPITERHDGTAGTGARIERTAAYDYILDIRQTYGIWVEWLELDGNGNSNTIGECAATGSGANTSDYTKQGYRNCIVHPESSSNRFINGIHCAGRPLSVHNCIVYNVVSTGTGGSSDHHGIGGDDKMSIINSTCYNVSYANSTGTVVSIGKYANSANAVVKNCLAIGLTGGSGTNECYEGSLSSATTATNGSSDSTGDTTSMTAANEFVSTVGGSEDLHLKAGATAIDAGTDLVTTPADIEVDIDGTDRDANGDAWDMGAHLFIAAVSGRFVIVGRGAGGRPRIHEETGERFVALSGKIYEETSAAAPAGGGTIIIKLAGNAGLAGKGGLAGRSGGLAG